MKFFYDMAPELSVLLFLIVMSGLLILAFVFSP